MVFSVFAKTENVVLLTPKPQRRREARGRSHSRARMVNPGGIAQGLALFFLGGAIASVLPRPLQEDKRTSAQLRKYRRSVDTKTPREQAPLKKKHTPSRKK